MSTTITTLRLLLGTDDGDDIEQPDQQYLENPDGEEALDLTLIESVGPIWRLRKDLIIITFAINLAVFVMAAFGEKIVSGERNITLSSLVIRSVAGGATLASTVLKVIPEALRLLEEGYIKEVHEVDDGPGNDETSSNGVLVFVVAIMAGFLLSFTLRVIFLHFLTRNNNDSCCNCDGNKSQHTQSDAVRRALYQENCDLECCNNLPACAGKEDRSTATTISVASMDENYVFDSDEQNCRSQEKRTRERQTKSSQDCNLQSSSLSSHSDTETLEEDRQKEINRSLGCAFAVDALHSFMHGVFVGNSFLSCDACVVYAVAAATLYNLLPQANTVMDHLRHHCGLGTAKALILILFSSLFVTLGASILVCLDAPAPKKVVGIMLAISAGLYLYGVGYDSLPRDDEYREDEFFKNRLIFLLCFGVGAVPIGLVMINIESHDCL